MKGKKPDKKAAALSYVMECLTGRTAADENMSVTIPVPEGITDHLRAAMIEETHGGFSIRKIRLYLGDLLWDTYSEAEITAENTLRYNPVSFLDYIDHGPEPNVLQADVSDVFEHYHMLLPGNVTLEKDSSGQYGLISCTIRYSGDGTPVKITAGTINELSAALQHELDVLVDENGTPKDKAINYIRKCSSGKVDPSTAGTADIIIPDDLSDSLTEKRNFYTAAGNAATEINASAGSTWYTEEIVWFADADYRKAEEELRSSIRRILDSYYMLRPDCVTFEKNANGKYAYICCTIGYSGSGTAKRIRASSLSGLAFAMELELCALTDHEVNTPLNEAKLYAHNCLIDRIPYDLLPCFEVKVPGDYAMINNIPVKDIEFRLSQMRQEINSLRKKFYMLRPGEVTVKRHGDRFMLHCTIGYSRKGTAEELTARTANELQIRMESELDMLMAGCHELYAYKEFLTESRMNEYFSLPVSRMVENDDRICNLLLLHLSGTKVEQDYARSELIKIAPCFKNVISASRKRELMNRLENPKTDIDRFISAIDEKIGKKDGFKSYNDMAYAICCTSSQLSKVRNRQQNPSKEIALRLGIAFHYSADKLTDFVEASGNKFPTDKKDVLVLDCIERGVTDYYDIDVILTEYDPHMSITADLSATKRRSRGSVSGIDMVS